MTSPSEKTNRSGFRASETNRIDGFDVVLLPPLAVSENWLPGCEGPVVRAVRHGNVRRLRSLD